MTNCQLFREDPLSGLSRIFLKAKESNAFIFIGEKGVNNIIMEISERLNNLLEEYDCTARELAQATGLSVSVISRYRSGTRHPSTAQLRRISEGFARIMKERGMEIDPGQLFDIPAQARPDTSMLIRKFNILASILGINMNDFSRFCSYDPSMISRVRSKQRELTDPEGFAQEVGGFLYHKYRNGNSERIIAAYMGIGRMPEAQDEYIEVVREWLCSGELYSEELLIPFAEKPDDPGAEFMLKGDGLAFPDVSSVPDKGEGRVYHGIDEIMSGELDFLRYAIASGTKSLYMYSDFPYHITALESDYINRWIYLVYCAVSRGTVIHIITKFDTPAEKLSRAMARMLPVITTGRLRLYSLTSSKIGTFFNHCYVSDDAVMYGEGLQGSPGQSRCRLTFEEDELLYHRAQMKHLMGKVRPMMNVYRRENDSVFRHFFNADVNSPGERMSILSGLHIGMMDRELAERILSHNELDSRERELFMELYEESRNDLLTVLGSGENLRIYAYAADEESFRLEPQKLFAVNGFLPCDIRCTYEEYTELKRQALALSERYPNYFLDLRDTQLVSGVNIVINKGKWAVISRTREPLMHFVIRDPDLISVTESMALLLTEGRL